MSSVHPDFTLWYLPLPHSYIGLQIDRDSLGIHKQIRARCLASINFFLTIYRVVERLRSRVTKQEVSGSKLTSFMSSLSGRRRAALSASDSISKIEIITFSLKYILKKKKFRET